MADFTTAEFWDDRYAKVDSVWSITPNQFVVEYLSELPVGNMIDLAGGEGRNALWFASRGWQAENADISSVAIEKFLARAAAEGLRNRVTGTVISVDESASYKLAPADLGLIAYLQIPTEQLAESIRGLVAGLKTSATFFAVWHARENLTHGFGGPQREDVLPTAAELRAIAETVGLSILDCRLVDRVVEVDGETKRAIDVILHATVT